MATKKGLAFVGGIVPICADRNRWARSLPSSTTATMAPTTKQILQNMLNINLPTLEMISLLDSELTEEGVAQFVGHVTPGRSLVVGLSGGYSSSGVLNTLALAVGYKILLIQFRSKTKANETAVADARKLLSDSVLCRSDAILYAFDMGPLALGLYSDHGLPIESGIDIQSACSCDDPRSPLEATKFMTASTHAAKIYPDNIRNAFESRIRDLGKPETSVALAMRAWLASFVPTLGDMEERLREVPKINTKSMPADVSVSEICQSGTFGMLTDPSHTVPSNFSAF